MRSALILVCAGLLAPISHRVLAQVDRARVSLAVDSIAEAALRGGRAAGMSVAVVQGRDTLVLKGYGKADLELDAPTPDHAVYEIGSVTKQFTATAILQLAEQHKLSLDDDMTKYFPSYPMHGYHVTIRRLMDHTSGIRGYTEIPAFGRIMARSLPRDSVVAMFSAQPFDFAPGDVMAYSNSAYFLLGLIVEKVSGQTYEQYLTEHLFASAGMPDTRYCSTSAIVPRRAHGYDFRNDTLRLAAYIDMIWPFSAGALCSTAGDLAAWNRALHVDRRLLSPASYHELITPGALSDGTVIRYAKGLALDSVDGHRRISHGGGIPGFLSTLQYFPDDSLTVVVLVNTAGPVSPDEIARSIVDVTLGAKHGPPVAFHGRLDEYTGAYAGVARGGHRVVHITVDSASQALVYQPTDDARQVLSYVAGDTFAHEQTHFTFVRTGGRVTALTVDEVYGYNRYSRQP